MDNKKYTLTKEEKAEIREGLVTQFKLIQMSLESFAAQLRKIKTWKDLAALMRAIHECIVENDRKEMRLIYGLLMTDFLASLAAGGSSDADIIATRMSMAFENTIEPQMRKVFEESLEDLDNVEETDSSVRV